ncbi:MAG: hypothetical protein LBS04_00165 [Tannerellaceae bacterium]|jgi:hypothetical protein|nr:hypothetical protein [Tannerellaceae bacterium]
MSKKQEISITPFVTVAALLIGLFGLSCVDGKNNPDENAVKLEQGFLTPPEESKPRVWWHWMNGNITKEGIRADLEWMKRVGIGGFQNFDAGLSTPPVVEKRLVYMTPEWKEAFRFTAELADSLGLEMAIAGSPGWSESGGPWVKPEEAMKKYVWTETRIEGGNPYSGTLPKPYSVSGPFQNLSAERGMGSSPYKSPDYYADAAVIAWRMPESEISLSELNPKIASSGGNFALAELTDGDLVKSSLLPFAPEGQSAWIQFEFPHSVSVQALTVVGGGAQGMFQQAGSERFLESSNDGREFLKVTDIPPGPLAQTTLSFKPVTGKYFRFAWKKLPAMGGGMSAMFGMFGMRMPEPKGTDVAELALYGDGRVHRFEEKAAFVAATDLYDAFTPAVLAADAIKKSEIIDITDKMEADGTLHWTPPAGKWAIMRLGYSLTGHTNGPASPEATGLEVDKLSAKHVKSYFTNYLDQYKSATNGLMGERGLQYVITDSWEAGTQNWTDDMLAEFRERRGYDMLPWIPVLSGHIVESAEASDKFLWDYRKTLADLVTENHYDQLTTLLKERGMGRYSESHEARRAFIGDGMEAKRTADVPMGAAWTPGGFGGSEGDFATVYQADVRESASAAHIYGQNLVAAEALSAMGSDWAWSPALLKPIADYAMACGLNRFVIHTSVHQPLIDKAPGLSLGPFGQWFTRNETWAEQAIAWTAYLARSCYMLQQGVFVADIAYYYGEDNNITVMFSGRDGNGLPDIPKGYSYDFVNADALVNLMTVDNGQIVTSSGMSYRVLVLDPNSRYMTLTVLRKIRDMVNDGAIVTGVKPVRTPSLADDEEEFNDIVNKLWAKEQGVNNMGKGKVYAETSLADVLKTQNIAQDFGYVKPQDDTNLFFVHRKVGDINIYWIANHNDRVEDIDAAFRVEGMEPEIWRPETGMIEKASYSIKNRATKVHLHLEPSDAIFVVFRNKTGVKSFTLPETAETRLATVEGEWDVSFQAGRGAPEEAVFASLTPWNENENRGIKYFSGTGTYSKILQAPAGWFASGAQLWLDLGDVQNLAEVAVNGKSLGIVWKKPFRVNVTGALKQGDNNLEIKVTNLWVNRLIGDRQPDERNQITFTTSKPYTADTPLKPSGLLGPVTIIKKITQ